MNELTNEMIAEEIRFCQVERRATSGGYPEKMRHWILYRDGEILYEDSRLPDFLHSMDTCLRLIVPTLQDKKACIEIYMNNNGLWTVVVGRNGFSSGYIKDSNILSEAFCHAAWEYFKEIEE